MVTAVIQKQRPVSVSFQRARSTLLIVNSQGLKSEIKIDDWRDHNYNLKHNSCETTCIYLNMQSIQLSYISKSIKQYRERSRERERNLLTVTVKGEQQAKREARRRLRPVWGAARHPYCPGRPGQRRLRSESNPGQLADFRTRTHRTSQGASSVHAHLKPTRAKLFVE